jgi:hypothetical protein
MKAGIKSEDDPAMVCPWWINSPDHFNCFWEYVRVKSNQLGEMPQLNSIQIGKLMGWPTVKANEHLEEAMKELYALLKCYDPEELFLEQGDKFPESYNDSDDDYTFED